MKWSRKSAKTWSMYHWIKTWMFILEHEHLIMKHIECSADQWICAIFWNQWYDVLIYFKNLIQWPPTLIGRISANSHNWKAANFQQFAFQFNSLFIEETNATDQNFMRNDSLTNFNLERWVFSLSDEFAISKKSIDIK